MTNETHTIKNPVLLINGLHVILKVFVQLLFPAFVILYFVFDLPNAKTGLVIAAIITIFFGMVLNISTKAYNKSDAEFAGEIVIHEKEGGGRLYSLDLNSDPAEIAEKKTITFKVVSNILTPQN